MKKILFLLAILPTILASCSKESSSEEVETIDTILANTSWIHTDSNQHTPREYEDYQNKTQLDNAISQCSELEFSIGDKSITEKNDTIKLCDKDGHSHEIAALLTFSTNKCIFDESTSRQIQTVNSKIEETEYTFKEGSYIGGSGGYYYGVKVYAHGIYRSTTSGDVIILPLDGNFKYNLTSRTYKSKVEKQEVSSFSESLSFSRDNKNIKLYNEKVSFDGVLNASSNEIAITKENVERYRLKINSK